MRKLFFIVVFSLIVLAASKASAISTINENAIKYRYYIKVISSIPYFENDLTLNFEKHLSLKMLENEVERTFKDYDETLNFIDMKDSLEVVIYSEYLKMLKEKLASNGIFPRKFDDIRCDSDRIYENIFESFSFEFNNFDGYNVEVPYIVKKTKRIFPYLSSKINDRKIQTLLFNNFLACVNESKKDPAQDAYKKAIAFMNNGFTAYFDEKYFDSCKSFGDSIPYWEQYMQLSDDVDSIPLMRGLIKLHQGNSAVEYDMGFAKTLFEESINNFNNMNAADFIKKTYTYHPNVAIGEIFYRKNDVQNFLQWMNTHMISKADEPFFDVFGDTSTLKSIVMNYEWNRLTLPDTYNSSSNGVKQRKAITNAIKKIEALSANTPMNNYKKKFIKRYSQIMDSNISTNSNPINVTLEFVGGNSNVNKVYAYKNDNICEFVITLSDKNGNVVPKNYSLTLSIETQEATFENNEDFFKQNNFKSLRENYGFIDGKQIKDTLVVKDFINNQCKVAFKYTSYAGDLIKVVAAANLPYVSTSVNSSIQVWKKVALKLYGMKDPEGKKNLYPEIDFAIEKFRDCFVELIKEDYKTTEIKFHNRIVIAKPEDVSTGEIGLVDYLKELKKCGLKFEKQKEFTNIIGTYNLVEQNLFSEPFGITYPNLMEHFGINNDFYSSLINYGKLRRDQEGKSLTHEIGHAFRLKHPGLESYTHDNYCVMFEAEANVEGKFCKKCQILIKNNFLNIDDSEFHKVIKK